MTKTIDELIKITGITDFNKLTGDDAAKILKLIGEQRLKAEHIQALVQLAPGFISLATESLHTITTVAKAAGNSQAETLQVLQRSVDGVSEALRILAKSAKTDKTREKIAECIIEAGRLYLQLANISRELNSDNNDFWLKMAGIAASVLITVVTVFAAAKSGSFSDEA